MTLKFISTSISIFAAISLLTFYPLKVASHQRLEQIAFDGYIANNEFYLEVKNSTHQVFILDELFMTGYNILILGFDKNNKQIYITTDFVDLDRGPITLIEIYPGNFHRTIFKLKQHTMMLPEKVKHLRLKWTSNDFGTALPANGLVTSIFEREKIP